MAFSFKKLWRASLQNIKKLAPIAALVLPGGKVRTAVIVAGKLAPLALKLFQRKEDSVNPFETAVRQLIELIADLKDKSGFEIVVGLIPAIGTIQSISSTLTGVPKEQYVPQIKQALDNMIGSEPNALIGDGPNAKIRIDLKYVDIEALTDLILAAGEKALLAQE